MTSAARERVPIFLGLLGAELQAKVPEVIDWYSPEQRLAPRTSPVGRFAVIDATYPSQVNQPILWSGEICFYVAKDTETATFSEAWRIALDIHGGVSGLKSTGIFRFVNGIQIFCQTYETDSQSSENQGWYARVVMPFTWSGLIGINPVDQTHLF